MKTSVPGIIPDFTPSWISSVKPSLETVAVRKAITRLKSPKSSRILQLITCRLDLTGGAINKFSCHFSPILLDNKKRINFFRFCFDETYFKSFKELHRNGCFFYILIVFPIGWNFLHRKLWGHNKVTVKKTMLM